MKTMTNNTDMLKEYDFRKGIRGKYAKRFKEGTNIVMLDPDVAEFFPDSVSVNEALRSLAIIMKKYKNKMAEKSAGIDR